MWPKVFALDIRKYELPVHAQTKTFKNILGFTQEVGWQYQLLSRNWSVCARNTPTSWQFSCKHDFLYVSVSVVCCATRKHRRDVITCTFLAVLRCVASWIVPDVSMDRSAFTHRVKKSPYQHHLKNKNIYLNLEKSGSNPRAYQWIMFKRVIQLEVSPRWLAGCLSLTIPWSMVNGRSWLINDILSTVTAILEEEPKILEIL